MTTTTDRPKAITLQRSLLVGGLVLVTVFLVRLCLVPLHPVLDGPFPAALMAAVLAAGAWWVAFRWWRREPDAARSHKQGETDRKVGAALLTGGIVLPLYLFFRLWLLPLLPGFDGLPRAMAAAGLAGGVASWLVHLLRRS